MVASRIDLQKIVGNRFTWYTLQYQQLFTIDFLICYDDQIRQNNTCNLYVAEKNSGNNICDFS